CNPSHRRRSPREGASRRPLSSPSLVLFLLHGGLGLLGRLLVALSADRVLLILLRLVHARRALRAWHPDATLVLLGRGRRRVAHVLGRRFLARRVELLASFDDRVGHLLADQLHRA